MSEEKLNKNLEEIENSEYFQLNDNDKSYNVSHLISIISWFIFVCILWHAYDEKKFLWGIYDSYIMFTIGKDYIPLKMNMPWLQVFLFLLTVSSFCIYLFFTIIKKKKNLLDGMLDSCPKYHFLTLLLISSIFIIEENAFIVKEEILKTYDYYEKHLPEENELKYNKKLVITDLVFTIVGELILFCVYINLKLNCHWLFIMIIKKGFFSSLIIILWYHFFEIIIILKSYIHILDNYDEIYESYQTCIYDYSDNSLYDFYKGAGIAFNIVIGLGSFAFSYWFKDLIAAFVNFLIYIGLIIGLYGQVTSDGERDDFFDGNSIRVIDIMALVGNLILILTLISKDQKEIFQ